MTTPLLLLRCVQLGIHISELELLTIGTIKDMYSELQRDDEPHNVLASQDDFDRFGSFFSEKTLKKEDKLQ